MVKKYVFTLSGHYDEHDTDETTKLLNDNNVIISQLKKYKNYISTSYFNGLWDMYKKFTNDYELVFTSSHKTKSVSKYIPISRSFFKLWEILHDFEREFEKRLDGPVNCFFIAEGPGGFVEAYSRWRNKYLKNDCITVTTLYNTKNENNIPSLKIPKWVTSVSKQFNVTYGKDGTGNVCNMSNILHYVGELGHCSQSFITADGGFDYSSNFNCQESMSSNLIACEMLLALYVQKEHGIFVLKVFDISLVITLKLLYILSKCYKSVNIIKPVTSRPANSEKYLVCVGFNKYKSHQYIVMLTDYINNPESDLDIQLPSGFLNDIIDFNNYFVSKQILFIIRTMKIIKNSEKIDFDTISHNQLNNAIEWCNQYNIRISSYIFD